MVDTACRPASVGGRLCYGRAMAGAAVSARARAPEHLDTLDSLRGFAAMAVCLFHLTGDGMPGFVLPPARALFSWGWAGVDVFFVISGFVIPYVMMRDGYRLRDYGGFIGRRLLRVGPPSWGVVAVTAAAFVAIDALRGGGAYWSADLSWPRLLHNLAYTIPFTGYLWIDPVFWTLAVELQFYLLVGQAFPFVFAGRWRFVATAFLLCAARYLPLPAGLLFLLHEPLFLIGGAALLHREGAMSRPFYLGLLLLLVAAAAFQVGPLQAAFGGATALAISFVPIRSRTGAFFGRISYSLYLVHSFVGAAAALVLVRLVPPTGAPAKLAIILAAVAAAILAAWLYHRWVETFFVGLARRTFGRRRPFEDRDVQPPL